MSFSYSLGNNPAVDYPRLLVGDTVSSGHIFEDEEILMAANIAQMGAFSGGSGGVVMNYATPSYRYIAATLLESLAANKARLLSAIQVLDIRIEPAQLHKALLTVAEAHRDAERNSGAFAAIEMVNDPFGARERFWKEQLRMFI